MEESYEELQFVIDLILPNDIQIVTAGWDVKVGKDTQADRPG